MNHADILKYLDGVSLQKAFQSDEVTADEVARVLLDMASERLRAASISPDQAELVSHENESLIHHQVLWNNPETGKLEPGSHAIPVSSSTHQGQEKHWHGSFD